MDLTQLNFDELKELAKEYDIKVINISEGKLRAKIEEAAIRRKIETETKVRAELLKENEKKLGLVQRGGKKVKPSPETEAIEASKKVYAIFHNMDQPDPPVDVKINKGGKYIFHLFPERVHVLPQFLIDNLRQTATNVMYSQQKDPKTGEEVSVPTGRQPKYIFDVLGDAPDNAKFGVVLDEKVLKNLKVPLEV